MTGRIDPTVVLLAVIALLLVALVMKPAQPAQPAQPYQPSVFDNGPTHVIVDDPKPGPDACWVTHCN